jgi:hypothetical protein
MPINHLPEYLTTRIPQGLGVALASCAVLAACQTPAEEAVRDPNHLTVTIEAGNLSGAYNPASFDEEIVRQALAANCSGGQVATYAETIGGDGLTNFTATCVGGTSQPDGTYTFQRAATRPATPEEAARAEEAVSGM